MNKHGVEAPPETSKQWETITISKDEGMKQEDSIARAQWELDALKKIQPVAAGVRRDIGRADSTGLNWEREGKKSTHCSFFFVEM